MDGFDRNEMDGGGDALDRMDADDRMLAEERVAELLEGVDISLPEWVDKLPAECPFCGREIEYRPQGDPDVVNFWCECGHTGFLLGPRDRRDPRYVTDFEAAVDELEKQLEEGEGE